MYDDAAGVSTFSDRTWPGRIRAGDHDVWLRGNATSGGRWSKCDSRPVNVSLTDWPARRLADLTIACVSPGRSPEATGFARVLVGLLSEARDTSDEPGDGVHLTKLPVRPADDPSVPDHVR